MATDRQPLAQHGAEAAGERFGCAAGHRLVGDDDELVAAQSGDHALRARADPQPLGEDPDEPVTGGVPEVVVDRLQPVEVHVEHGDRAGVAGREPVGKVRDQRPPVVQAGQVVVFGQVAQLLLGRDPGLRLREQRRHRLEGVDLLLLPLAGAELDEAQHPGGHLAGDQRGGSHRRRCGLLPAPDPAGQRPIVLVGPDHHRLSAVLALREHRVGAGEMHDALRIGIRHIGPRRPFGDQHRGTDVVIVVTQKTGVHVELLDELSQDPFADLRSGGRGRLHELGSHGGDDEVQAARHRSSDLCTSRGLHRLGN